MLSGWKSLGDDEVGELLEKGEAGEGGDPPETQDLAEDVVGRAGHALPAHPLPERFQLLAGAGDAIAGEAVGEDDRVHRAGAGARDRLDVDAAVLDQAVDHTPGEGAVGAAALKREANRLHVGAGRQRAERFGELAAVGSIVHGAVPLPSLRLARRRPSPYICCGAAWHKRGVGALSCHRAVLNRRERRF